VTSPLDDLGAVVPVRQPARRVVSLVQSLTEALASVDPAAIVGATFAVPVPTIGDMT
jgi:hypothetical protein